MAATTILPISSNSIPTISNTLDPMLGRVQLSEVFLVPGDNVSAFHGADILEFINDYVLGIKRCNNIPVIIQTHRHTISLDF